MTIKRVSTRTEIRGKIPFFRTKREVPDVRVLEPGYKEHVKYSTLDDEGRSHVVDDAILRVESTTKVTLDVLLPGTISEHNQNPESQIYSFPNPDNPGNFVSGDKGLFKRFEGTEDEINTHFPDVYTRRDQLFDLTGREIFIHYEPDLPPQSRK